MFAAGFLIGWIICIRRILKLAVPAYQMFPSSSSRLSADKYNISKVREWKHMQISNNINKLMQTPPDVKQGDMKAVNIKERLSDTEAIVQMQGKEVRAKFEGGVPSADRAIVQVTGQTDEGISVKEIVREGNAPVSKQPNITAGITNKDGADVKKAAQILSDKGITVSKETVQTIKNFMNGATGTPEAKLETVRALANKGLEVTSTHLRAIHETLHGKPVAEVIQDIAKAIDPDFKLEQPQKDMGRTQYVQSGTSKQTIEAPSATNQSLEAIKSSKSFTEAQSDIQKIADKVRNEVVQNPNIDREISQKVDTAVREATSLNGIGRERILQTLKSAEATGTQVIDQLAETQRAIQSETDMRQITDKVQQLLQKNNLGTETANNIERMLSQANQLDEAGKARLLKVLQQLEQSLQQKAALQQQSVQNDMNELEAAEPEQTPSDIIKQMQKSFQNEADLDRALAIVKKELSINQQLSPVIKEQIEKSINLAQNLQDRGREIAARSEIANTLTDVQNELMKTEPQQQAQAAANYDINEQLMTLPIQAKNILVTKVTQKMAELTQQFRDLKREISVNLSNVERVIDTFRRNAYPQAKQMLETAISKLDNAILKSDMMLYADMRTERQLMQASGQLADAKKLLAKGEFAQAGQIVKDVKALIDKVIYKPSDQKVMHFVNKEAADLNQRPPAQQALQSIQNASQMMAAQDGSARQMFEAIKSFGLNHDSDAANSLVLQKNEQQQQEQQNLKAALLKLTQGETDDQSKAGRQAEQALMNITGQQLLSKADPSGTLQSMFFNLPMMLGEKQESLQVFVNSKNEGQEVDWENCSLYFLMETRKLGDVGILLNATERNLSITIKNDKPHFEQKMQPLAEIAKERLKEIGYNVSSLGFAKMTSPAKEDHQQEQNAPVRPVFTEKGMDFKI